MISPPEGLEGSDGEEDGHEKSGEDELPCALEETKLSGLIFKGIEVKDLANGRCSSFQPSVLSGV